MKSKIRLSVQLVVAIAVFCTSTYMESAHAETLPETTVRVIGSISSLVQVKKVEKPFWTEEVPRDSGGKIKVVYNNLDTMGAKEQQVIRFSEAGIADFASTDIVKIAGDDPIFEGCDLAGIAPDIKTARKASEAWKPAIAEAMEKKFNTKLLALAPNPGVVFWSRSQISKLSDVNGKKVRVFGRSLADFVTSLGGSTVTTPFGEAASGLQNGVFDIGLTTTLAGNSAGWHEVTQYLYPMTLGWSIYFYSVNLDTWKKFSPETRAFFEKKFMSLEDRLWEIGEQMYNEGVSCNIGKDPCTLGKKGSMTLVPVTEADEKLRGEIVQNTVLKEYGKRAGKQTSIRWNDTVGKELGLRIPVDGQ